ncbi:MAG: Uma2 family endonuclease [Thermoflexibacter sp.]|nr:Uma2 family endonuclease [Thermoflexibacter sp.]
MEVLEQALTAYEIERNKPMPNLTHGAIQANLVFELKSLYRKLYRIASEVSLDTLPVGSTPDVVIYPPLSLDFISEPARRSDAPLVTIEIQSPSQSLEQMVDKTDLYFQFGVKSCWIILPSLQAALVFDRPSNYKFFYVYETLHDPNLNINIPLADIFA